MKDGLHINSNGNQVWYHNNQLHREDGPAMITNNFQSCWLNGVLHNINGPAVEWNNGQKFYYLHGIPHTKTQWEYKRQLYIIGKNIHEIL